MQELEQSSKSQPSRLYNEPILSFLRGPEVRYRAEPFANLDELQTQVVDKMNEFALENTEILEEFYTISSVKNAKTQRFRNVRCNNQSC